MANDPPAVRLWTASVGGNEQLCCCDGGVAARSSGIRSIPVSDNLDLFRSLLSDGAVWAAEANAPTTRRVSGRSHSSARPQPAMVARLVNARLRPKWSIAYPPKVVLNAAPRSEEHTSELQS